MTPTTTQADSSAGYTVDIHVPQNVSDATMPESAPLQNATVTLPAGVTINPAQADGAAVCTDAEFGIGTDSPSACPQASLIGTATVTTPLLPASTPLTGGIYLAQNPGDPANPFHLFIEAVGSGVDLRLKGTLTPDPGTGQLTTVFANNPQIPFSDLELQFNSGPRAPLANPLACGLAQSGASLQPGPHPPRSQP